VWSGLTERVSRTLRICSRRCSRSRRRWASRGSLSAAGLWRSRCRRVRAVHVWRERRAAFGEDISPFRWLEDRGANLQLIALIDDASSRIWARFTEHDSTEENLRTLRGWLQRYGRPLALYTDKNGLFVTSRPVQWQEQLQGQPALTQFGRALRELDIAWIAAHSPQAKGRVERLFRTTASRPSREEKQIPPTQIHPAPGSSLEDISTLR
jgi:hypothetical protein